MLSPEHVFEYGFAKATSLACFMYIEIEHAKRLYFTDTSELVSDEKSASAYFDHADDSTMVESKIHPIVRCIELGSSRDDGRQTLAA